MPITLDGTAGITSPGYGAVSGTTGTFSGNVTANGLSTELRPLVLGTAKAFNWNGVSTNTFIDFESIPSWVKRVTITFDGVSTSGTSHLLLQIGDSGGIETTGYTGGAAAIATTSVLGVTSVTTGFELEAGSTTATTTRSGNITLAISTGTSWTLSGVLGFTSLAGVSLLGGVKALSAALDRVRITTVNGTDTFDAGTINIMYE